MQDPNNNDEQQPIPPFWATPQQPPTPADESQPALEIASTPEPTPAPAPEPISEPQPIVAPQERPIIDERPFEESPIFDNPKKRGKGLKVALVIVIILALAGLGYSAYAWMQGNTQQSNANSKTAQIKNLQSQVATLQTTVNDATTKAAAAASAATAAANTFDIPELGISITLPTSIKDLTYSYLGNAAVGVSTDALTDASSTCLSYPTATTTPALGTLTKATGTYSASANTQLVKQFSGYYISYSASQTDCDAKQSTAISTDVKALTGAFSTVNAS